MGLSHIVGTLLKGKVLATVLVGVAVVGGATAAAATPVGQQLVQHIVAAHPTTAATGQQQADPHATNHTKEQTTGQGKDCPGLVEAQQLASSFSLATQSTSTSITMICALHQGTFNATTTAGASVASARVFGYGEIHDLLTYAQFLASQTQANASGKLTDANVGSYLAQAVQKCSTSPLMACLQANMPNVQPGNDAGGTTGTGANHGGGKPSSTPTPPSRPTPPAHP